MMFFIANSVITGISALGVAAAGFVPSVRQGYNSLSMPGFLPSFEGFVFFTVFSMLLTMVSALLTMFEAPSLVDTTVLECAEVGFVIANVFYLVSFFLANLLFVSFLISIVCSGMTIWVCVETFLVYAWSGWLFVPTTVWTVFVCYSMLTLKLNNRDGSVTQERATEIVRKNQKRARRFKSEFLR